MDSMIDTTAIRVHIRWAQQDGFFIWGTRYNNGICDAYALKDWMFAWHAPSFYGAFIEVTEAAGVEGLFLPALEALHYLAAPAMVQHQKLTPDTDFALLTRLAAPVRDALAAGRFMPDFAKWKAGELGWKLELPERAAVWAASALARQWMERLIPLWIESDGVMREHLKRLERSFPLFRRGGQTADTDVWMDEEDWLVSIGWQSDGTPFRTCLKLEEAAAAGGEWPLRIVLQDRADKEKLIELPAAAVRSWAEAELEPGEAGVPPRGAEAGAPPRGAETGAPAYAVETRVPGAGAETGAPAGGADAAAANTTGTADAAAAPDMEKLPAEWRPHILRAVRDTDKWTRMAPWLADEEDGRLRSGLTQDEAWLLLTQGSLRLMEAGYSVFLPAWWERIRKWKPRLKAKIKSSVGTGPGSTLGLNQLMRFDWKIALGDLELTEAEFRELLAQNRKLVQIRGQWVQLDPAHLDQLQQVMKQVQKKQGLTLRDVLELHLLGSSEGEEDLDFHRSLQMEVELNEHLQELVELLNHTKRPPLLEPPASFRGTLRPYQLEGISWLLFLRQCGLGGCLADDMGLGKTIQMITYLLHLREQSGNPAGEAEADQSAADGRAAGAGRLPTTGYGHMAKEAAENDTGPLKQGAPGHGSPSLLVCPTSVLGNWQKELQRFAPNLRVHLHYGPNRTKGEAFAAAASACDIVLTTYTLSHLDEAELAAIEWEAICLDEAQNIKNAYTKQSSSIRNLKGRHRIALTGTPIENRLTELWSIFDFLNPGYLGTLRDFTQRYVNAIERTQDAELIGKVQRLIRPFLLRRVKKDPSIQLDLPDKYEYKSYISLTAEQATLYETYIRDMFERLDKLSTMERRGLILAALTKLKQICNHPGLAGGLGNAAQARLDWRQRSNKVERLLEMVQELRQEGDKCLIFTQFVETGHLLQRALTEEFGGKIPFLHGGTVKAERDRMIDAFQEGDAADADNAGIFLLSLKAGGTGLNLTAANHVFHFDRWWNPAVENQATDRAFRIGQTRHVQVHKFVTLGTLEERIDEMIDRKLGLSQQIVGTGEQWITELSTSDLKDLFALRSEWVD
ncbi:Superfamily II DNA or RNA helicase, SNF2 family [Paenibacillus sp. UNCCL117]|uniref:DEAD/DEAH box helicase n=1 Tax=unclassified Paenibacillus TaxID=185978 RepID=UPI00088442B8|nr:MULTISPECIES: DEAD/DEAH box helicase [unclassified Paenibacillus]SDD16272.1 Superfamily II DNA or RNA helicase, SNF2 family [Paenibacillus sp. cl123]SFW34651.1 Superfamily II DNA or RNA helicase, SNF2 family [Paenibacillus sp. UNCCL117]